MTKEELEYIQAVCREWLQQPSAASSKTVIAAAGPLSQPVEVERSGILTFDNVLITSAVDTETGVCYTKLIKQPDGLSEFFDTPSEKIAADENPVTVSEPAIRTTRKKYHDAMQQVEDERSAAEPTAIDSIPWWIEKEISDSDERPKYQLYTKVKLLGYSLLERKRADENLSGRFYPSEDYFEYAPLFVELPQAENECMETNARAGYGIPDERGEIIRARFAELSAQVAALDLYLMSEVGTRIETSEIRLEDLSDYYNDQAERWLHAVVNTRR
ncbi:MAG TPA: hypothetical protein VGO68_01635 [Pyrinomonadaceae bacterium]|jgi:hypothetical protein|nr:hypothetical protein [Pyrinomonadaceae bacterium]